MSTIINGANQNEIDELKNLSKNLYENIFKVNLVENGDNSFVFYNLLNKVIFPVNISDEFVDTVTLQNDKPWTTLSYELYGTIDLWWTVYLLNKPDYIFKAQANNTYKYIKSGALPRVLEQIRSNQS